MKKLSIILKINDKMMKKILFTTLGFLSVFSQNNSDLGLITDSLIRIKKYDEALLLINKDTSRQVHLTIKKARLLSWKKEYKKSIEIYENLLINKQLCEEDIISYLTVYLWNGEKDRVLLLVDSIIKNRGFNRDVLLNFSAKFINRHEPNNKANFLTVYFSDMQRIDQENLLNKLLAAKNYHLFLTLLDKSESNFTDQLTRYKLLVGDDVDIELTNKNLSRDTKELYLEKKGDIEGIKKVNKNYKVPIKNQFNYYFSTEGDQDIKINRNDIHINSDFYFIYNFFYKTELFFSQVEEANELLTYTLFSQEFYRKLFNHEFRFAILSRSNDQGWLYGYRFNYLYHFSDFKSLRFEQKKEIVNDTKRTISKGIYKNNYSLSLINHMEKNWFHIETGYSIYNDLNEQVFVSANFEQELNKELKAIFIYQYKDFTKTVEKSERINYWLANNLHILNFGFNYEKSLSKGINARIDLSGNYISINQEETELSYKLAVTSTYYFSDYNYLTLKVNYLPSEIWESFLIHFRVNLVF
jgi:hypothetical protein